MKQIIIDSNTRQLNQNTIFLGYLEENKAEQIQFVIPEEYKEFGKKASFRTRTGEKFQKTFDNITSDILTVTKDITKYRKLDCNIEFFKIEDNDEIIAKTSILHIIVSDSIVCDDIKEETPQIAIIDNLITQVSNKISEVDNIDFDISKKDYITTIILTKKDKTQKIIQVLDGVALEREFDYNNIQNKPSINGKELRGNIENIESTNNKTSNIDENSTENEYPSAKAVYNLIEGINNNLEKIITGEGV